MEMFGDGWWREQWREGGQGRGAGDVFLVVSMR